MSKIVQHTSWNDFYQLIRDTIENKLLFLLGILANGLSTVASVLLTSYFSELIDSFSSNMGVSNSIVIFIVTLFLLQIVFGVISVYVLNYIGLKAVTKVRDNVLLRITYAPMSFFDGVTKGALSSRVINDSSVLMNLITSSLSKCIGAVISITMASVLLFKIDVVLTVLIIGVFFIFIIFLIPLTQRLSRISRNIQEKTALLSSYIVQTLTNIRIIKSTVSEEQTVIDGNAISKQILDSSVSQVKFMAILSPIVNIILLGSVFLVIAVGGIRVVSNNITMGQLSSFLMLLVLQILTPASTMIDFLTSLQSTRGALERIMELSELEIEDLSIGSPTAGIKEINFENVSFSYPKTEKIVLDDISFSIKQGERIALIGPSGSGKSTIFSLIEGFYKASVGSIKINQQELSSYSLKTLREQLGYVTQDILLVNGTIRENLLYGTKREISDEELLQVCEQADIKEYVVSLENGLDSAVGENGVNLSGGQKQRLTIARMMLSDASVILLDEATSSLDSISENRIQASIEKLSRGRITMIIAHRLSTVLNATKIIFLDGGKITGIGTHQELLETHDKYKLFYNQQFSRFIDVKIGEDDVAVK